MDASRSDRGVARPVTRHVSIRVPEQLFEQLEQLAFDRGETVSRSARRLLADGIAPPDEPLDAIDDAVRALQRVREQLVRPVTPSRPDEAARTVNVLNAKTNLSRLLADVGRGEEIVISHAGTPRARLVPVGDPDEVVAPDPVR